MKQFPGSAKGEDNLPLEQSIDRASRSSNIARYRPFNQMPQSERDFDGEEGDLGYLLQSGYRFAYSLTHHREDAEDLVQRAWVRLQRRYAGCDSAPLMFRAVRNLFYDDCRRAKIVPFTRLDDDDGLPPVE